MSIRFRAALIPCALFLHGCLDPVGVVPVAEPVPAPDAAVAYIVMSPEAARTGDTVTLQVRTRTGSQLQRIGSYTMRVAYDSSQFRFVAAERLAGALRLHNLTRPGELRIAGAAPLGFGDDALFAGAFVALVSSPTGVQLHVEELTAISSFADLTPLLRIVPAVVRSRYSGR